MLFNYNGFLSSIEKPQSNPTPLFYDNQNVIHLVKNLKFHHHSKHIDPQYNFIWEKQEFTKIDIHYIL
jgi:hypothetical protein